MARFALLGIPVFVWLSAYLFCTQNDEVGRFMRACALALPLRLRRSLTRLAHSRLVGELLSVRAVATLCDAVVELAAREGVALMREEACGFVVVASGSFVLACVALSRSLVAVPIGIGGCVLGVYLWDSSRTQAAERELVAAMPGVFRTLATAMGSGQTLAQAVDYVGSHERGAVGKAFRTTSLRMRCGEAAEQALERLSAELDAPGMGLLITALLISQRTGSPLKRLFEHSAQLVERQGEFERMLVVKTAQVRLSVRIVSLLPPIMVAMLSLLSVDFRRGLMTFPGMACLALATVMDVSALIIIRRIMKGVL